MREFKLPDLGEGLTEAEIVEWHVAANDDIKLNQPLVSVETDKAVVEVPSPVTGRVISLHGEAGDVIPVGDVLARFDVQNGLRPILPTREAADAAPPSQSAPPPSSEDVPSPGRADASSPGRDGFPWPGREHIPSPGREHIPSPGREDVPSSTGKASAPPPVGKDGAANPQTDRQGDAPGVVGKLPASALVMSDTTGSAAATPKKQRVKAAPSVRALARELGVDLTQIEGSGPGGRITAKDVAGAAKAARVATPPPPGPRPSRTQTGAAGSSPTSATDEKLSGPRRAMFHSMTASHSEVALCTVMDDADIHDWESPRDFTPRLIRAMVAGARAEPRLNGAFNAETGVLSMSEDVHMGLAMETPHGLIVATIYNAGKLSLDELRDEVARLKRAGADRTLKPEEVRGYTITLSNIAGGSSRYATPLMVPPTVGILGSGAAREEVVAVNGEIAIRRVLPLSLTFDHRCVAGADASRFLGAVVADLKLAS